MEQDVKRLRTVIRKLEERDSSNHEDKQRN